MATGYGELLRSRHVLRLLTGTLVGRLPHGTAPLAIVLFARAEGGSYTLAGVLSALYGLATAVGQPLLGRLVDVHGQPRVMGPAAVVSAVAMGLFAAVGIEPLAPACALILLAGVTTPPLEGGLRALWASVLGRADRVHRAYALDAVAQEAMFAGGPLIVMLLVAAWSGAAALLVINAVGLVGAFSVLVSRPSRRWRGAAREAHWLGALRSRGLLALLGCFFFVGAALGAISVASVAYADARGEELVATYLLSALGGGALVGGLVYGARQWPGAPERRLRLLTAALAAGYLPLALVPSAVPLMTLLAGVSGIFLAPVLACAFVVIDRHAPTGTVTEAFSWLVTTFGVGAALGTAVVGPVIEWGEDAAGFAVAGVGGVLALAVLLATRSVLAAPGGPPGPGAGSQNDRNAVLEPGFRSGHRA
ncbi:MFS transporter [Streptomyces sp. SBT349]|uniref:MFS transporter n=1 Tax=Streptomyces sp. SBT349 TaxID=1580539 RepID=UPI00066DCE1C|nr:MFS transporter [Streptomyces sp. SBT349]